MLFAESTETQINKKLATFIGFFACNSINSSLKVIVAVAVQKVVNFSESPFTPLHPFVESGREAHLLPLQVSCMLASKILQILDVGQSESEAWLSKKV